MASTIQTTAISLRKGDTEANLAFTGIRAELVADLGSDGTGTDLNTTLRLHNAVVPGGIPMARADLLNISTRSLAEGRSTVGLADEKNLAYADLSNLETLTDSTAIQLVLNTLASYGLAKKVYVDAELALKANLDMSNVDTADLATGEGETGKHAGKNLAYADTSNINTADLTSAVIHTGSDGNKPLAYADGTNIDPTGLEGSLARKDLTNVASSAFTPHLNTLHVEYTTNKVSAGTDLHNITDNNKYPSVPALKEYVASELNGADFLKKDFTNAENYDVLYANTGREDALNNTYTKLYKASTITTAGTGFSIDLPYLASPTTTIDSSDPATFTDHLKVYVSAVNGSGIPTTMQFYQSKGTQNIGSGTSEITDGEDHTITINYSCTSLGSGLYLYALTMVAPSFASADFTTGLYDLTTPIPLQQLLWVKVNEVGTNNKITNYSYIPSTGNTNISTTSFTVTPESGTNARVGINVVNLPAAGGAGLAKTDLSNLLGMTQSDIDTQANQPWRVNADEAIPTIDIEEANIPANKYNTLATHWQVWEVTNDAYLKTMGTAAGHDPVTGNLVDVASYVKTTLDNYALSDTYLGQVLYYLPNESTMPTTRPGGAALEVNDQVLLKQKSDILDGRPYLATWNGTAWTYAPFISQDSAQANGDYVYCLDLGTWDTENYYNAPGNITWNHRTQQLDIAPDYSNVPDEITIKKDATTGKIGLAPFYVPAPEFFNGDGATTVFTLNANNCPNGKVPFDLYVDGAFQYPTIAYTFNASNRKVTFADGFAPRTGTKNIAVIYRGIIFGTGANAGPINGKHS